jgi:hypothetical protein
MYSQPFNVYFRKRKYEDKDEAFQCRLQVPRMKMMSQTNQDQHHQPTVGLCLREEFRELVPWNRNGSECTYRLRIGVSGMSNIPGQRSYRPVASVEEVALYFWGIHNVNCIICSLQTRPWLKDGPERWRLK